METLKLLLAGFEFPPYPLAGTGQYAVNLIKHLEGHDITLITAAHGYSELEKEINVKKIDIGFRASKVNRSFLDKKTIFAFKLRKYLKSIGLRHDLFHSLTLRDAAFIDHKFIQQHMPTVVSVNDYYIIGASLNPFEFHFKSVDFPIRYLHHNLLKQFYLRSLKNCSKIIANADFTKKIIISSGIDEKKVDVVRRGIDTRKFDVAPATGKYSSHRILFVGPNMERKGAIFLARAAPAILKKFPDATFTLVGDAPAIYMNKLTKFLRANNIAHKFRFIRHVAQQELVPLYASANVFVMPSIIEALGQVYMEAMMAGTPVIGADVGGVSEIITRETGHLVKPQSHESISDVVMKIFSGAESAEKMGAAGRQRIKNHFSIERMTAETLDVYKKVLAK